MPICGPLDDVGFGPPPEQKPFTPWELATIQGWAQSAMEDRPANWEYYQTIMDKCRYQRNLQHGKKG